MKYRKHTIAVYSDNFYMDSFHREIFFLPDKNIIESTFKNIDGKFKLTNPVLGECRIFDKDRPKYTDSWTVEYNYIMPDEEYQESDTGDNMLKELLEKHVTIFKTDGTILQGFLTKVDDKFAKLVELDNQVVIVRVDSIDLVRTGIIVLEPEPVQEEVPEVKEQVSLKNMMVGTRCRRQPEQVNYEDEDDYNHQSINSSGNDFAMVIDNSEVGRYKKPSFLRTTKDQDVTETE